MNRRSTTKRKGYLKATVIFRDRSQLHVRELVDDTLSKIKYAYHYQDQNQKMVFRYDNAPHHAQVTTFPHHKHVAGKPRPKPTKEKTLIEVVKEIAYYPSYFQF